MKQAYTQIKFTPEKLSVIETAIQVVEQYAAAGFDMTVRQLYYQMVAKDLFPDSWMDKKLRTKNTARNYKRLGEYINDGRMCGLVDWDRIVDRTRALHRLQTWPNSEHRVLSAWRSFRMDKWENQPYRVEVWVEKEAMEGVIEPVCNRYEVPFFCCRGYPSQSAVYAAAQRFAKYDEFGQQVVILHLGDHDPSGIDMTRDIVDRMITFLGGDGIEVDRLALNWSQIQVYNPPPNFAKQTDSRYDTYEARFGDESWELDALEPQVISTLIENAILSIRDDDLWDEKMGEENAEDDKLRKAWRYWDDVNGLLEGRK